VPLQRFFLHTSRSYASLYEVCNEKGSIFFAAQAHKSGVFTALDLVKSVSNAADVRTRFCVSPRQAEQVADRSFRAYLRLRP
jgi:hypothetical protein